MWQLSLWFQRAFLVKSFYLEQLMLFSFHSYHLKRFTVHLNPCKMIYLAVVKAKSGHIKSYWEEHDFIMNCIVNICISFKKLLRPRTKYDGNIMFSLCLSVHWGEGVGIPVSGSRSLPCIWSQVLSSPPPPPRGGVLQSGPRSGYPLPLPPARVQSGSLVSTHVEARGILSHWPNTQQ